MEIAIQQVPEKKNASISLIRMVAISFVVINHIIQTYGLELCWWINVGSKIFLIISGYLIYNKEYNQETSFKIFKKQFSKILSPYYLWLIIVVAIYLVFSPSLLSIQSILESIVCTGTLIGQGHLWYIPYILFCYIITPYLSWIKSIIKDYNLTKTIVAYCIILIGYIVLSSTFNFYFSFSPVSCYLIGYFLRDLLTRFNGHIHRNILIIVSITGLVSLITKIYLVYVINIQLDGFLEILFSNFSYYTTVLLALTIFLGLLKSKIEYNRILLFSDKYSYEIYLVHALFILSPLNFLSITNYIILNIIISIGCVITTAIVFKYLYDSICKVLNIRI